MINICKLILALNTHTHTHTHIFIIWVSVFLEIRQYIVTQNLSNYWSMHFLSTLAFHPREI